MPEEKWTSTLEVVVGVVVEARAVLRRVVHVAEGVTGCGRRPDVVADEEGRRVSVIVVARPVHPGLDGLAEDVGHRLVDGARLTRVHQVRLVLGDCVGQLMGDDVEALGQAVGGGELAIAVDHLGAVPKRVDIHGAIVDGADERGARVVV